MYSWKIHGPTISSSFIQTQQAGKLEGAITNQVVIIIDEDIQFCAE
jgi:hypothetical protein